MTSKQPKKSRKRNYINNREMYQHLVEYLDGCDEAEAAGKEIPPIPKYLGECFLQIAQKLSTKPNFAGYPFIEEMRSDGVINCVKYIRNFKPLYQNAAGETVEGNPFAYFTQYIKNAFLQRIQIEKKNLYTRHKAYQDLQVLEAVNGQEGIAAMELNDISNEFIKSFEQRLWNNKRKVQTKKAANTVTKFFDKER